jgi:hypothetical protein
MIRPAEIAVATTIQGDHAGCAEAGVEVPVQSICPALVRSSGERQHRVEPSPARTTTAQPDRENLAGLVERVTFHNEESGFCVLRVRARGQRDLITVIGHAATIGAGEFVQASGRWVNDRTHGVQFRADFLRAAPPTTAEGIEKYLASGMIKGISPIYATKLAFREQVFDVIEQTPIACNMSTVSARSAPRALSLPGRIRRQSARS